MPDMIMMISYLTIEVNLEHTSKFSLVTLTGAYTPRHRGGVSQDSPGASLQGLIDVMT